MGVMPGPKYALQMLYAMDMNGYLPARLRLRHQDLNRVRFVRETGDGVHGQLNEIDVVLQKYAEHWKIHRMAVVDRNLLRLSLYELMYLKEVPFPIVINEALEIIKEFSDQEGTQFLNGILDAARKEFRGSENVAPHRHGKSPALHPPPKPEQPGPA